MNFNDLLATYTNGIFDNLDEAATNQTGTLNSVYEILRSARIVGRMVYLIGNGGSATLASHMATDLQLGGVRAVSLTDVAAVTTYMNDDGASFCFRKQIKRLGREKDILIAISTSGNSPNMIEGIWEALSQGMLVIGMTGRDGGRMKTEFEGRFPGYISLHCATPPSTLATPISQDLQQIVLHILTYALIEDSKKGN